MTNGDKQNSANTGQGENVKDVTKGPITNLPPTLSPWKMTLSCVFRTIMIATLAFLVYVCFRILQGSSAVPDCACWVYLSLFLFLASLMFERYIGHTKAVHKTRREDESEVRLLIQEAKQIRHRPRWVDISYSKDEHQSLTKQIDDEIDRLEKLGPSGWVEYEILALERLIVDVLDASSLVSRARSSLAELEEYALGNRFSYDTRQYSDWEERINSTISKIEMANSQQEEDNDQQKIQNNKNRIMTTLRSDLRSLLDHKASYELNWSSGTTIVNQIKICGAAAVIVFIIAGLFEVYYPDMTRNTDTPILGLFSWGLLGSAGAIISVLHDLRNTDIVEVGNTQGAKELWDAVLGAILGFVAGILVLSILAGKVIMSGGAVPDVLSNKESHVYLSVIWAVVAGMWLEKVFSSVRKRINL